MAGQLPLEELTLVATSLADDLSFVALADLSAAFDANAAEYRVIGGHMLTALVGRWELGAKLYRETGDTDLGVPPIAVKDGSLVRRLIDMGYKQLAGDRFARPVDDIPAHLLDSHVAPETAAVIDFLIPAYTSRARSNRRVSDELVVTEVRGLAFAFLRPPVSMKLAMRRLNGKQLEASLQFPDEVSALVLKGLVTKVRTKDTDAVDIWRCLEVCFAADVQLDSFDHVDTVEAGRVIRSLFANPASDGMRAIVAALRLSQEAANQRFTRIRALMDRVLG